MRKEIIDIIYRLMQKNEDIVFLTADLGYKVLDQIKKDFPQRFYNVGASEQLMIGIAVGVALSGKKPICYSITSFLLYRPFEIIRNYVNYEKVPIKLIGSGRDKDYNHDGISHWSEEDKDVMGLFNNIESYWPNFVDENKIEELILNNKPVYINLKR
jgi:transketolase